jgi:hypothetical protein
MTSTTPIQLQHVTSVHGYHDYDVIAHPILRRACVPLNIRKGQFFNVYHGESSKTGVKWLGGLEKSLAAWLQENAEASPETPASDLSSCPA